MNRKNPKKRAAFNVHDTIEDMLDVKPFDELLKDGDIFDIDGAHKITGYSVQHLRRLCQQGKIEHVERGEAQYFFLPRHLKGVFKTVQARA